MCLGQLPAHLWFLVSYNRDGVRIVKHTALGNLGKSQAGTSLQIYVVGKYEGAQSTQGLSREEISLAALKLN